MAKRSLIIDVTSEQIISYLCDAEDLSARQPLDLNIPLKVAVVEESDKVNILAGEVAEIYQFDDKTIVFDNVVKDLPEIEDEIVQEELWKAVWTAICFAASRRYRTIFDDESTGFIIYPQNYSARLLEAIRTGCARSEGIKNIVFINETVALMCGLIDDKLAEITNFEKNSIVTVAAVVGQNERNFEVICFDYNQPKSQIPQFLIKDYFRVTEKNLVERLKNCEWKHDAVVYVLPEAEKFSESASKKIKKKLESVFGLIRFEPEYVKAIRKLKSFGALQISKYAAAEAEGLPEFEIINAANIGIRIDRRRFFPVLQKNIFNSETKYPCFSAKSFEWTATAEMEKEFVFGVYAGYTEFVQESAVLGYLSVNAVDLSYLKGKNKSELVAVACLNKPGEGEFTLGLMPENRIIGKLSFVLPGMVC